MFSALEGLAKPAVREYAAAYVVAVADESFGERKLPSQSKLEKYALRIVCGLVIGDWFNTLPWHASRKVAA
jgi:DNA (cytosine-5)-methyltransferase 1